MAEPALAYPQTPPPCPALDAILAHDEYSLPAQIAELQAQIRRLSGDV